MKKQIQRFLTSALVGGLGVLLAHNALAVPYASGVKNTGGTISFILNESADNVKVVFNGSVTNDLGAKAKGTHSFSLGSYSTYQIEVTKSAPPTWTQISDDLNPLVRFYGARGVAVVRNASDLARFGRIYVTEPYSGLVSMAPTESVRTTTQGFYALNADTSDALGQGNYALNAGISFGPAASSACSPYKIDIGQDNLLYISDMSTANATIFRADLDLTSHEVVLDGVGSNANMTVHTTINGSAIAKGSLGNNNLVVWAIDGAYGSGNNNRLMRWDINGGPLPYAGAPTQLGTAGNSASINISSDLDIAPDGKMFVTQFRAAGTANVYDANRVNLRVYDTDGTTLLFDSLRMSLDKGWATDLLVNTRAVKVSPDGSKVAIARNDTQIWVIGLTNGIPDFTKTNLINAFGGTSTSTSFGREVCWDAAGNLYSANHTYEKMRIWSPGGTFTAITKSDGTFTLTSPPAIVGVTAATSAASENGPTNGMFTLTRSGDTTAALTVNFTLTGGSSNGVDYATVPTSITFAPGATSTNIAINVIDDAVAELTESVVLTIATSPNYALANTSATVNITDNESPELSISAYQPTLLEGFISAKATFRITRRGQLGIPLTANVSYSGTATQGTEYSGPSTVSISSNAVNVNFNVTNVITSNDQLVEGTETIIATVGAGTGYSVGTGASATVNVIDDDLSPGTSLFADNFSSDSSANWMVNSLDSGTDSRAEFGYDYSAHGIPEAPNSAGSFTATKGLKLQLNQYYQVVNTISCSPSTGEFTGDYRLKFDMWINFNGPLSGGGPSSSEYMTAGVGNSGYEPMYPTGTATDGGWFAINGDGGFADTGTTGDLQAFLGNTLLDATNGVYAAGTAADARGNFHSYYSLWGSIGAPATQVTAYPTNQNGVTDAGTFGLSWHSVVITRKGTNVMWDIDGRRIATLDISATTMGNNIFVGYCDQYAGTSAGIPSLRFAIVDNLVVETIPASRPQLAQVRMLNGGTSVQISFAGESSDTAAAFGVSASANVEGGYANASNAVITQTGPGAFQAVLPVNGARQFYRIYRK